LSGPEPMSALAPSHARGPLDLPPPSRRLLLLVGGLVAAVYLLSVNNAWWPTPDSALYQGLAKNMVEGHGYVFNGRAHTTVTPGLPLILGGLRLAFGEGYWAPNLVVTLCGLGGLLLAWLSLRRLTDEWTALLAVVGCAACYKCFHYSHLILTDAPFFLLFWALTYVSLRLLAGGWGWLAPVAVLTALALAIRAPGVIVVGPLSAALLLQKAGAVGLSRRVAAAAVVLAALALVGALCLLASARGGQPSEYINSPHVRVSLLTRLLYIPQSLPVVPSEIALGLTGQRIWVLGLALLVNNARLAGKIAVEINRKTKMIV
jgi:4-amino-4-deoxy-L-arabinose transferase-like glycosyltransferase